MDLQRMISSQWFTRLALVVWMICAISLVVIIKNMELIVHVQLYEYGLQLSPVWLDPYRVYSSLIYYLCLLPSMLVGGIALLASFNKENKVSEQKNVAPNASKVPRAVRAESQPVVKVSKIVENCGGTGFSCPGCKKVFRRALVMLDFRNGKTQLVSVCPYCNYVLGITGYKKSIDETVHVAAPDKKIIQ